LIYNVRWIFTEKQIPRQNEKLIRKCKMQALLTESLPGAPKSQHLRLHIIKNKVNTKDRGAPKSTGVTSGDKAGHLPPGAALWGRQIEVGMLRTNYEMLNVSAC